MDEDRDKIILKNSILNFSGRIVYYILSFISVPLLLKIIDEERFGIFQTILTFLAWASLANLGIGNGLRNKISEFLGGNREKEIRGLIGSAFTIAFWISLIFLIITSLFIWYIFKPEWIINKTIIPDFEIKLTFLVTFFFFSLSLFFGLFISIAYGVHKSYLSTLVSILQYFIYCSLLLLLIKTNKNSYLVYVAFVNGVSIIASQIFLFFSISKKSILWPPNFKERKKYYHELLNISVGFFVLQISSIILFSSDNLILSKLLGPSEVTQYSIASKIFFTIISFFSIILIQVWNSTTDALVQKDFLWIKRTVLKLHKLLILVFIGTLIIGVLLNFIVRIWIGNSFEYSLQFRLIYVFYVLIHCSNAIFVNVLNGLGKLKLQTIAYITGAIINFVLAYIFIVIFKMGIIGVLYSKLVSIIFTNSLCMFDYKRFMKSVEL